ncbi:helix-turn-helix domain-containing protein [Mucilaginibacter sp.]|uniref:winged helix-turn-helix transcriptional regulator n=1 Tax=Mucilaginibacter sp. TaxID=1882438 RepID=UPI0026024F9A|nr:helix-turn-helix domain-containing protein [Mucilaginibacter sp.]MDB4920510.1 transcriptional regulator [Mucilaginibacter sp.]
MNNEHKECNKAHLAMQDTLMVVGGKWKLVLLSILITGGKKRFRELSREAGISPRILSKELQELEMNELVSRTVCNTRPVTVEYAVTPYSETLLEVITAMNKWDRQHRGHITGRSRVERTPDELTVFK